MAISTGPSPAPAQTIRGPGPFGVIELVERCGEGIKFGTYPGEQLGADTSTGPRWRRARYGWRRHRMSRPRVSHEWPASEAAVPLERGDVTSVGVGILPPHGGEELGVAPLSRWTSTGTPASFSRAQEGSRRPSAGDRPATGPLDHDHPNAVQYETPPPFRGFVVGGFMVPGAVVAGFMGAGFIGSGFVVACCGVAGLVLAGVVVAGVVVAGVVFAGVAPSGVVIAGVVVEGIVVAGTVVVVFVLAGFVVAAVEAQAANPAATTTPRTTPRTLPGTNRRRSSISFSSPDDRRPRRLSICTGQVAERIATGSWAVRLYFPTADGDERSENTELAKAFDRLAPRCDPDLASIDLACADGVARDGKPVADISGEGWIAVAVGKVFGVAELKSLDCARFWWWPGAAATVVWEALSTKPPLNDIFADHPHASRGDEKSFMYTGGGDTKAGVGRKNVRVVDSRFIASVGDIWCSTVTHFRRRPPSDPTPASVPAGQPTSGPRCAPRRSELVAAQGFFGSELNRRQPRKWPSSTLTESVR